MAVAIVCLSVVVVTGFVGQLSLAQMALAGFGVWVASRLVDAQGWPFWAAAIAGVVLAVPLGLVVALPALRTRGINLAVVTFGLAVVIFELVLHNSALTGKFAGTNVGRASLGIDLDAFDHPERYGLLVLAMLVVTSLAVRNLRRSRSGRRLIAVRENERAAAALGVGVQTAKLYAFGLGAALAAIGGILLAFRQRTIVFEAFQPLASIQVVLYSVIGGIGYVTGPLYGSTLAAGGVGTQIADLVGWGQNTLDVVAAALLVVAILTNQDGMAHANSVVVEQGRHRLHRRRPPSTTSAAVPTGGLRLQGAPLEVEDISVHFGGVVAVDGVSLRVGVGEVLGLIGPNGAGKTTLVDAITGFVTVQPGGSIRLDGRPLEGLSAVQRARLGLGRSFQSLELFEAMTVGENLLAACDGQELGAYVTDLVRPAAGALSPIAAAVIAEFDLQEDLDRYPGELSHGRRRLVAIARSIAAAPRLLLLDEPASGLNEHESAELGRLIRRMADDWGLGILLIEHDVSLVLDTCDRVVVLDFGRKIAEGSPASIAAEPGVQAAYLGVPEEDAVSAGVGAAQPEEHR
jgi:sulfate-transporting ATPase